MFLMDDDATADMKARRVLDSGDCGSCDADEMVKRFRRARNVHDGLITGDDVLNLRILLNTTGSVDEFLREV